MFGAWKQEALMSFGYMLPTTRDGVKLKFCKHQLSKLLKSIPVLMPVRFTLQTFFEKE
jgi:hypothetical protein